MRVENTVCPTASPACRIRTAACDGFGYEGRVSATGERGLLRAQFLAAVRPPLVRWKLRCPGLTPSCGRRRAIQRCRPSLSSDDLHFVPPADARATAADSGIRPPAGRPPRELEPGPARRHRGAGRSDQGRFEHGEFTARPAQQHQGVKHKGRPAARTGGARCRPSGRRGGCRCGLTGSSVSRRNTVADILWDRRPAGWPRTTGPHPCTAISSSFR